MSGSISGISSGPGGLSVSGVGTGSSRGSVSSISGSVGRDSYGSDTIANNYNMHMANTSRRQMREDFDDYMNYNNMMYNTALAFSERMSNTAIQRQVKDLIAAGLNPVLAARLGGASYSLPSAPYFGSPTYQSMPYYDSSISRNRESNLTNKEIAELNNATSELNNIRTNSTNMSMSELTNSTNKIMNELTNFVSRQNNIDNNDKAIIIQYLKNETDKFIEKFRQNQENKRALLQHSETYAGFAESTIEGLVGSLSGKTYKDFMFGRYGFE